jgi:hypothetical protein
MIRWALIGLFIALAASLPGPAPMSARWAATFIVLSVIAGILNGLKKGHMTEAIILNLFIVIGVTLGLWLFY